MIVFLLSMPPVVGFAALGVLAWWRSRMREISVGHKDIIIKGKSYDRASGIDSTGKKVQMLCDGKKIVVARWPSVQRAMMLSNAISGYLGFKMDEAGSWVIPRTTS